MTNILTGARRILTGAIRYAQGRDPADPESSVYARRPLRRGFRYVRARTLKVGDEINSEARHQISTITAIRNGEGTLLEIDSHPYPQPAWISTDMYVYARRRPWLRRRRRR